MEAFSKHSLRQLERKAVLWGFMEESHIFAPDLQIKKQVACKLLYVTCFFC